MFSYITLLIFFIACTLLSELGMTIHDIASIIPGTFDHLTKDSQLADRLKIEGKIYLTVILLLYFTELDNQLGYT